MTLQNNTADVKFVNDLLAANNPIGLIASLKANGITTPTGITEIVLSNLMNSIFENDKQTWLKIVRATQYNANANNWTTTSDVRGILAQTIGADANSKIDFGSIFTSIGDFFGGSSTTQGGSTTTKSVVSPTAAAIVTLIVVAIIGVIIWKS